MQPPIDPDLFDSVTGTAADLPERRLLAAVLFDAIIQLARRGSAGAAEAARWIRERDDNDTPFSFTAVCEGLGLDAEYLARGLLAWDPEDTSALPTRRTLATHRRHRVTLPARRARPAAAAS